MAETVAELLCGIKSESLPNAWLDVAGDFLRRHAWALEQGPVRLEPGEWALTVRAFAQLMSRCQDPPTAWMDLAEAALRRMQQ